MDQAGAQRAWERLHQAQPYHDGTFTRWAEKPSEEHPFHYNDGVTVTVGDTDDGTWDQLVPDGPS